MKNLSVSLIALCIFGCKDEPKTADLPLQKPLYFSFKDTSILNTLCSDSFKIYDSLFSYNINGAETFFSGTIWKGSQKDSMSFISSKVADIVYLSAVKNIKTFYLHLPNMRRDTLIADYFEIIKNQNGQNTCVCDMPLKELKFNGKYYIRKTDYSINGIYIFDR